MAGDGRGWPAMDGAMDGDGRRDGRGWTSAFGRASIGSNLKPSSDQGRVSHSFFLLKIKTATCGSSRRV